MKQKKPKKTYAENRDKELKNNFLITGVLMIGFGIAIGAVSLSSMLNGDEGTAAGAVILLICAVLIVGGIIYMTTGFKDLKEKEQNENISGTDEYKKLMKRHDKAIEKHRRRSEKTGKILKTELRSSSVSKGLLACFVIVCFGFLLAHMIGIFMIIPVSAALCVPVMIYFIFTVSDYNKLKNYAAEHGIDFIAAEEDFADSACISCLGGFLSVGDRYTIIVSGSTKLVIENSSIAAAAPSYKLIDNYTNGLYSGTTRQCYVNIFLCDGCTFNVQCSEFAEELVIEAYKKRAANMHEDFSVYYPENAPAYITAERD